MEIAAMHACLTLCHVLQSTPRGLDAVLAVLQFCMSSIYPLSTLYGPIYDMATFAEVLGFAKGCP